MALDDLTTAVERALSEVHQLEATVSNYKESSQQLLFERINNVVRELASIQSAASGCDEQVPVGVISLLDEGKNPDQFARVYMRGCIERNEATRGKVEAFKLLRNHLLAEMEDAFPDEAAAYKEMRTASAALTRQAQSQQVESAANGHSGPQQQQPDGAREALANGPANGVPPLT